MKNIALFLLFVSGAALASTDIRIQLELPTERVDGAALDVSELDLVTMYCGATQAEPFGLSSYQFPPATEHVARRADALPGHGDWWCSASVTDTDGRESERSGSVLVSWQVGAPNPPVIQLILTD